MRSFDWIRNLVDSERKMEETGVIDLSFIPDDRAELAQRTQEFLKTVKEAFVEYVTAFNNIKNSTIGSVKIYGISNTVSDFMLFRNGYKLLFSASTAGKITVSFQSQATQFIPQASAKTGSGSAYEETLVGNYGPLGDLTWSFRGTLVNVDSLVRYYLTRFVKESIK